MRLAVIVSHPIQYYVPLYRRLAQRIQLKVFFTWHGGGPQLDRGFNQAVAWDIPLTDGYEFEVVPNTSRDPGTHHFFGLRNPALVERVTAWKPDAVHLTGYAYASHLKAMRAFPKKGVRLLFRGDSHLLNRSPGVRSLLKSLLLRTVFRWPTGFLYVGQANKNYYKSFGVPEFKLFHCPHSIEVNRFAGSGDALESAASQWRKELQIPGDARVLLFAGKLEPVKRPLELMQACLAVDDPRFILLLVGDGLLGDDVRRLAAAHPNRFRTLPFQNQSKMPLVYRLGDAFVLPSWGETWGLAVNEALACGRPALVSDRVGCAADVIRPGTNGHVFRVAEWDHFRELLAPTLALSPNRRAIQERARAFDVAQTEETLLAALQKLLHA